MLLKKANTITTPTAYSNGFLHSVKPEVVLGEEIADNSTLESMGGGIITKTAPLNYNATSDGTSGTAARPKIIFDDVIAGRSYTLEIRPYNQSGTINADLYNGSAYEFQNNTLSDILSYDFVCGASGNAQIFFDGTFVFNVDFTISLKERLDADFTFQRNSSATRVNELGYIEDVQIIGGELVQNGDFEEIGSELVVNGSFSDDSAWILSPFGASISGGQAILNRDNDTYIYQDILTAGKIYKVTFDATINSGSFYIGENGVVTNAYTSGTYTNESAYFKVVSNARFIIRRTGTGTLDATIDNVSVKEVGQDWTFGTGWSIAEVNGSQVAQFDGGADAAIQQSGVISNSVKYRLSLDVLNKTTGSLQIRFGNTGIVDETITTNGTFTYDIISDGTTLYFRSIGGFDGYIDNISVKEVTDDTNLPRINYEGFTYENGLPVPYSGKGHLLLEGQRSNIALSGGPLRYTNATETTNYGVSPSGDNDSIKLESTTATTSYVRTNALSTIGNQCHSIYVKKGIGDYIQLLQSGDVNHYANYDIVNGVVTASGSATTASIESYGDWYRLIAVYDSVTNTAADARCYLSDSATAGFGGASSAIGNYCEFWGIQVEIGDYATSYIANTKPSTTVTRLGETCNNATQSFPSEGVLYAEIAALANDGTYRRIALSDNTSNNSVFIGYIPTSNQIQCYVASGGVSSYSFDTTLTSILDFNKIAIRFKENDFSLWVNGVQVDTDTSGAEPIGLSELAFDRGSGSHPFYGKTKMIATFPYLSNDEMECLTGEGYGTFEALAAAYSYTIK